MRLAATLMVFLMTGCAATAPAAVPTTRAATRTLMQVAPAPAGLMMPLYTYPTHAAWKKLIALKARHPQLPVVAIVNPDNGASWGVDPTYTQGIAKLHAAGITTLGYVFTSYGGRAQASVKREVTRWKTEYPTVDGIFYDEMASDPTTLSFYMTATADARALGFTTVVGNFGTTPGAGLADVVDVAVTYEQAGLPRKTPATGVAREKQALLAYGVKTIQPEAATHLADLFGFLYITQDGGNNPWDSWSKHADGLADLLDPV